jgi:hypothetical protein
MFVASSPILQGFAIGAVIACRGWGSHHDCANLINGATGSRVLLSHSTMLSSAFQFILISFYLTSTLAAPDFDWQTVRSNSPMHLISPFFSPAYSGHEVKLDALLLRFPMQSSASESLEFS